MDHQDYFLELLSEGHHNLVKSLFKRLTYPVPVAREIVELSQASYRAGRSDDSKTLRMEMSSLIDSMKSSIKIPEQETVTHYKNISEFSNQVTLVPAELATNVSMIEKMITQASLRNVTIPLPQEVLTSRGHRTTQRPISTSPGDDETSSNAPSISGEREFSPSPELKTHSLSGDDTYTHKYMTVKVLDKRIASIYYIEDCFKPLDILIKRTAEVAGSFLNLDLELLRNHFSRHPDWIQTLISSPNNATKSRVLADISYIKPRHYQ